MTWRLWRTESRRALLLFAVAALGSLGVFLAVAAFQPWSPKRGLGLAFGVASLLGFLLGMAYPARRARASAARGAWRWLQLHVYLGALALVAALVHAGFRVPGGVMGFGLLALATLTVASGLLGLYLQKTLPPALGEGLSVQATFERIPSLLSELRVEADALVEGTSDMLQGFYARELRGPLSRLDAGWRYLSDVRAGRERALSPLRQVLPFVEPAEKQIVDDLISIYTEKLELDAQYRLQWVLRNWAALHALPGALLLGLLAVHVALYVVY